MAAKHLALLLLLGYSISVYGQTKNVAEELKTCWLRDKTKLDSCLLQFWKSAVAQIKTGIPELNFPPSDPLKLDKIDWNEKAPAMTVHALLTNVKIYGTSNVIVTGTHADPKTRTIAINMTFPSTFITTDLVVNGTVMLIPISGNGQMTLNVTDMTLFGKALVEQQGTGLRYANLALDVAVSKIVIKFIQVSNDPVWDAIETLMNDNVQLIFDDIKPMVSKQMSDTLRNLTSTGLSRFPAEAFIA